MDTLIAGLRAKVTTILPSGVHFLHIELMRKVPLKAAVGLPNEKIIDENNQSHDLFFTNRMHCPLRSVGSLAN